jgi:glycosyltransferase involved in cell wall biosynthesis
MRIALLSPIAWRTPPRHYGPWENVVSLLNEGLVKRGVDVTLFASGDSITDGKLQFVCSQGYEENKDLIPKVAECLHVSALFEQGNYYDLIHNHFDYLPLTYSHMTTTPVLTTIHGFSSPKILPVYEKYNGESFFVSISDADRAPTLDYLATVHHGIDLKQFTFQAQSQNYLLFLGRIHHDKGAREAIEIAKATNTKLLMAGIVQDTDYYHKYIEPQLVPGKIEFVGSVDSPQRNKLLGGAKALLHPINFNEPFGLSVVEAMACGTPVIAINRGSMAELIKDGVNGFLVDNVAQAITAVGELYSIQRADCRDRVERLFSVDRMVDDYLKLYQKIIDKTARESHRPWGYYQILANKAGYKAKEIVVSPNKRLSLQRHRRRAEHWLIISGHAEVTIDEQVLPLQQGQSIDIPVGVKHRIANPSDIDPLHFVEVQTGDYFGEDDIERFADDYGRA